MVEPLVVSLEMLLFTRLSKFVMWLTLALFHLTLAVLALALLWWWQVQPSQLAGSLVSIPASLTVQWIGLLGCSAATLLFLYVRLWRKAYSKIATPYFFRGVTDGRPLTY